MMKTDKHFRFLCRNLSKNTLLYTEMIHSNAILRGNVKRLLDDIPEKPKSIGTTASGS